MKRRIIIEEDWSHFNGTAEAMAAGRPLPVFTPALGMEEPLVVVGDRVVPAASLPPRATIISPPFGGASNDGAVPLRAVGGGGQLPPSPPRPPVLAAPPPPGPSLFQRLFGPQTTTPRPSPPPVAPQSDTRTGFIIALIMFVLLVMFFLMLQHLGEKGSSVHVSTSPVPGSTSTAPVPPVDHVVTPAAGTDSITYVPATTPENARPGRVAAPAAPRETVNFTKFTRREVAGGTVVSGWNFRSSADARPFEQYCYFETANSPTDPSRTTYRIENRPGNGPMPAPPAISMNLGPSGWKTAANNCTWSP